MCPEVVPDTACGIPNDSLDLWDCWVSFLHWLTCQSGKCGEGFQHCLRESEPGQSSQWSAQNHWRSWQILWATQDMNVIEEREQRIPKQEPVLNCSLLA